MIKIILKKNEEKRILSGESLVYANEVQEIIGKDKNGSLAELYSFDSKYIGKGYINYLSKIIMRLMIRDDSFDTEDFFYEKIKEANDLRTSLGLSNSYRVVYSEADSLPGLIVDKYNDVLSIEISSFGLDVNKNKVVNALVKLFNPKGIYEKSEIGLRSKEGLKESIGILYGEVNEETIIEENGLKISVDVINGQKTGYFLDQKMNRMRIRKYTNDKTVLDCFSNTGGFTINAATNAKEVTALDISERAIKNVLRNAELNNFTNVNAICCDVFDKLRDYKKNGTKFDCIILDPPAFTKTSDKVKEALKGYKDINILAMKLLNDGGFLISSSCSNYVTHPMFINMLKESAIEAHKRAKLLEIATQAIDHPSLIYTTDTQYLKFVVLQIKNY